MVKLQETELLAQASSETDKARLLVASSPHSGDLLHAAPTVSIGRFQLSDEATRVAVAHTEWGVVHANHTPVCAVSRSMPKVYTVCPAAEVLPDNRDTVR